MGDDQQDQTDYLNFRNTSLDGAYYLSFQGGEGTEVGSTPILWLTHQFISAGSNANWTSTDISGMTLTAEEQQKIEKQITTKADILLKKLNSKEFLLED